ncbi:MAG TPA: cell division protein ZipA [Pseudomonadales bacterium]|nr:cell division protein ZipA [Pseudomonadales bacterium]
MREWLIALGILVVVAILLDCVRRMRNARRDSLQLSPGVQRGGSRSDQLDEYGNELPSGPARVVAKRSNAGDEPELEDADNGDLQLAETIRRPNIDLQQVAPILMDVRRDESRRIEPGFDADGDDELREYSPAQQSFAEPTFDQANSPARSVKNPAPVLDSATTPLGLGESEVVGKPRVYERPADQPPPRREAPVLKPSKPVIKAQQERTQKQEARETSSVDEQKPQQLALQEVLIISVMSRDRSGFSGAALLDILLASGLRYGHRNIFHCYTGEEREDEALYSVVNIVKPGTFDLNDMESFHTPGVSLFLTLPAPGNSMEAFESMLATAKAIAEPLNGELRDENRSVMTGQTVEHYRQRIRDFEVQTRLRAR